jgi:hypothetical protein
MRDKIRVIALALIIILTACAQNTAHQESGPGNGGGGDPRVAAFLGAAKSACEWMQRQPDLKDKAGSCQAELADLTASVNDPKRVPRVYSDDQPALDHGVSKDAVTDLDSKRIHINIKRWETASKIEQKVIATMEMSLLLGIPDRYITGKRLITELGQPLGKTSPEALQAFLKWAQGNIDSANSKNKDNQPEAMFAGQTEDHVLCALFITENNQVTKDIYLSLGVGPDIRNDVIDEKNFYIGGFVSGNSELAIDQHEAHFHTIDFETVGHEPNGAPITDYSDRELQIELTTAGRISRVTGTYSRMGQPVVCNITQIDQ